MSQVSAAKTSEMPLSSVVLSTVCVLRSLYYRAGHAVLCFAIFATASGDEGSKSNH